MEHWTVSKKPNRSPWRIFVLDGVMLYDQTPKQTRTCQSETIRSSCARRVWRSKAGKGKHATVSNRKTGIQYCPVMKPNLIKRTLLLFKPHTHCVFKWTTCDSSLFPQGESWRGDRTTWPLLLALKSDFSWSNWVFVVSSVWSETSLLHIHADVCKNQNWEWSAVSLGCVVGPVYTRT